VRIGRTGGMWFVLREPDGTEGSDMWNLLDDDAAFLNPQRPDPEGARVLPLFGTAEDETVMGWQERALCAQTDPEAFFPEKGGSTREAKKVCTGCEVRAECLEYALANDERFGIWGGLSERERRKLKKRVV
jgi:WhiB family transcriptional regulator, redox-sensing transcriptional regulator